MKTIAFIPIRAGSKSIQYKNIKLLMGKPLVYWNLIALENCKQIDEVVVATDSQEFKSVVEGFNLSKVKSYERSAKNAQDSSSTESVMLEYIYSSECELHDEDNFILVQATSPLTDTKHFEEALALYHSSKKDSLLSCVRMKRFMWGEDGLPKNYNYLSRPRRQDFQGDLVENGAFYINKVKNILKYRNRLSGEICIYEMPEYTFIEIDEENDWLYAELLMRKYRRVKRERKEIKLFISDVDGVLTDSGMYYSERGDELKKFNTKDGKGFEFLRHKGIKTGIITSEDTAIVVNRSKKLKIDFLFQGANNKLELVKNICKKMRIDLDQVAYIGDDVNDKEVLSNVGWAACPSDAVNSIKDIPGITILATPGGGGVVREFIERIVVTGA